MACALASDPEARYADARAMGEDLRRWFDGRLVHAYDATPARLVARFLRHYRLPIALATLALTALAASLAWGILSTSREAQRARSEARRAEDATQLARREATKRLFALGFVLHLEIGERPAGFLGPPLRAIVGRLVETFIELPAKVVDQRRIGRGRQRQANECRSTGQGLQ